MKSNKEFLEGVYKKAEEIQRLSNVHEKKRHFAINLKVAVVAAAVISIIPLSIKNFQGTDNSLTKAVPEEYSILENQQNNAMNEGNEIDNMISSSSLIATGEIISIEEDKLYIKVSRELKGKAIGEIISISKPQEVAALISEDVLVFLREGETSSYRLTEGSNSFFQLYTVLDNNKIYKSLEGFELSLKDLDNLIHGG